MYRHGAAIGLGVLAVAVFLAWSIELRHGPADFDESIFVDVGASIAATGLPTRTVSVERPTMFFDHTPAWVYYIGLLDALGLEPLAAARLTAFVAGAGSVALVYLIGWELRGLIGGFLAAMVLALNPFFARLSSFARMEIPLCLFLVLATYALVRWRSGDDRWLWIASIAIVVAVMLKEVALAYWLLAVGYAWLIRDWRAAIVVAAPTLIALAAWLAYAQLLDAEQLADTFRRWSDPAAWDPTDPRGHVTLSGWTETIVVGIVGWVSVALLALALVIASRPPPSIAVLLLAYVVVAVGSSFMISLKEPRYLVAVVPMTALAIGLLVDWHGRLAGLVGERPAAWARPPPTAGQSAAGEGSGSLCYPAAR